MTFLEKDLEQLIFETDGIKLLNRGLFLHGKRFRQLKIGNYGIADLVTVSTEPDSDRLIITVYELKRDLVNMNTFLQVLKYAKGIDRWISKNKSFDYKIYFVLIGRTIDLQSEFIYLSDFIDELEMFTYDYKFDGIEFTKHKSYSLINEGF